MVHVLRQQRDVNVAALLTTINEPAQRVAMHAVRVELLEAQADALGLPLWKVPIPSPCPNDVYERGDGRHAVARAVAEGFTHVAFGDLFLEDIRQLPRRTLAGTGLRRSSRSSAPTRRARARDGRRRSARATDLRRSRACSTAGSPAASSTRRSWRICRRPWTRAESAASFTRSRTAARCSVAPSPSRAATCRTGWVCVCRPAIGHLVIWLIGQLASRCLTERDGRSRALCRLTCRRCFAVRLTSRRTGVTSGDGNMLQRSTQL